MPQLRGRDALWGDGELGSGDDGCPAGYPDDSGVDPALRHLLLGGEQLEEIGKLCSELVDTVGMLELLLRSPSMNGSRARDIGLSRAVALAAAGTHRLRKLLLLVEWMASLARK